MAECQADGDEQGPAGDDKDAGATHGRVIVGAVSRNDVIIGVAALVLVVFSLVVSIVVPRRDPSFPERKIGIFTAVAVALVVDHARLRRAGRRDSRGGGRGARGDLPDRGRRHRDAAAAPRPAAAGQGDAEAGKAVFTANCGSCHTLEEAGTSGTVGPNLDELSLTVDQVVQQVTNGGGGMPPFGGQLSEEDIQNVAAFVVASQQG